MHQYSLGMTSILLHFHKLFTLCFLFFLYFMRQIIVSVDLFSIFILDSKIYSFSIIQHSLFPLSNTAVLGFESSPFYHSGYQRTSTLSVIIYHRAPVAQLVEHRAVTWEVVISTLAGPSLRVHLK